MVKISIIIPTYNRYDMLCEAIDSVLMQKDVLVEVIVVDDCSTDETKDILKRYPMVSYYRNEKNLGPGGSRRKGFLSATGDFVIFLDDDDFYTCDSFFKKASDILGINRSLSFVSGMVDVYDMNDNTIKDVDFCLSGFVEGNRYLNDFQVGIPKPLSTFPTIFSKEKLYESQIASMVEVNDSSIYLRALTQGSAYFLDLKIGCYRIHKSNITKGLDSNLIIRNLKEKELIFKEWNKKLDKPNDWWYQQFKLTYIYFLSSQPVVKDNIKVLLWGLRHFNSSSKMFYFLILHFAEILKRHFFPLL